MFHLLIPSSTDEYLPKPEIPKKELKWEEDLELRSKFLDRRVSHFYQTFNPKLFDLLGRINR